MKNWDKSTITTVCKHSTHLELIISKHYQLCHCACLQLLHAVYAKSDICMSAECKSNVSQWNRLL